MDKELYAHQVITLYRVLDTGGWYVATLACTETEREYLELLELFDGIGLMKTSVFNLGAYFNSEDVPMLSAQGLLRFLDN